MIRPFGLNDVLLVRRLQRSSAALAIEHILTHPGAPLWIALTAPWPWAGMGVATYVLSERGADGRLEGFVQLMKRTARLEADLLHLAPALETTGDGDAVSNDRDTVGEAIWERLLAHCIRAASSHGLQRIFVSIPEGGAEEACLKEVGYRLYVRETIYRLAVVPPVSELRSDRSGSHGRQELHGYAMIGAAWAFPKYRDTIARRRELPVGFRPQRPQDSWALQRLYAHGTPRLVQQSEGAAKGEVGAPPLSWWEPDRWQGIVWEPAGEVRGAVQVHIGRAGHWLRTWGADMLAGREQRALIEQGLRAIAASQPRGNRRSLPVYVTVRDYEIGLGSCLAGFGFAPYGSRARFVKQTTATVRMPAGATVARREVRQEMPAHSQPLVE